MTTKKMPTMGPCSCKPGEQRDNCPNCEGSGRAIDWRRYHSERKHEPTLADLRAAAVAEYEEALAAGYKEDLRPEFRPKGSR